MSKWKCEICNSSFENFDARGFDNKIYCPLCYYKKLYKDTELERERLHSIIKEVREYIEDTPKIVNSIHLRNKESNFAFIENEVKNELLEILDKEK